MDPFDIMLEEGSLLLCPHMSQFSLISWRFHHLNWRRIKKGTKEMSY
jgi:hypothetical protein